MESLKISQMLSPQLITVPPEKEIAAVLQLMQQEKCSCIVITSEDQKPAAIFTEHDLLHQLALNHQQLTGPIIQFAREAVVVDEEMHRNDAFILMNDRQVSHLVVTNADGLIVGVVCNKDFTDHFLHLPVAINLKVSQVMSRQVVTLSPKDTLQQALSEMDKAHISSIVVTDEGKAVGILSERDLVQLALERHNLAHLPLYDVMHTPVLSIDSDCLILTALQRMEHHKVRRFIVSDTEKKVCGIITHHDISRAIQMSYVDYLEAELQNREAAFSSLKDQLEKADQNDLLTTLMDQVRDGIYILSAVDLSVVDVNKQACRQTGFTREELIGKQLADISTYAVHITADMMKEQMKQRPSLFFHTEHKIKQGGTLPVEINTTLVRLGDDDYFVASARDISERLRIEENLKEREETYRSVIETSMDGFWIIDTEGKILEVNKAYCEMVGYTEEEILELGIHDLDCNENEVQVKAHIGNVFRNGKDLFESRHRRKDGSIIDVEVKASFWPHRGGRLFIHLKDITLRKQNELRLKQAAAVFENTNEAVMVVSAQRKIQRVNKAFCNMTGYSEEEVLGRSPAILQSGEQDRRFYKAMWHNIRTYGHWQGELISRRADGSTYPELLNISVVRDNNGDINHYVGVFADLSEQRESESRLMFLDYHDPLTGLANRKNLMMRTDHAIRQLPKEKHQVALIVIGLDRFKNVNDSYGHSSGDELLRHIASMLDQDVPEADTICRLGGDEFALLFDHLSDTDELIRIANNLIRRISQPWKLSDNRTVKLGASMGVSLAPQNGLDADTLLQHADAALFQAKNEGRSRLRFFSDELTQNARNRLELETRMHQALLQDELEVYFQPQVDILSQEIIGAEALVRWNHPTDGMIPPNDFIPQCEENGLIHEIGLKVLEQTCRQGKAWLDEGFEPIQLAVNLSAVQLRNPELYVHITRILLETGFPPQQLELELTESSLMGNPEQPLKLLQQLKDIGIKLAMDDFGTGYSSFTQLKQLPLDLLKIDKSFIDEIDQNQDDFEIVAAITAMGQALGLKVLAEGVETKKQLHALADLKCDRYQGYLLSKPIPIRDFAELRKRHKAEHSISYSI